MEQLQFDIVSLESALLSSVKEEMAVNADIKAVFNEARSLTKVQQDCFPADDELIECLSLCIAKETVKKVVRYTDYDPDTFVTFFGQGSAAVRASTGSRNASKANAMPRWSKPIHRSKERLTNCVITGWPGFDRTLSTAARAAVKDTIKSLTATTVGSIALIIAVSGHPEVAAVLQVCLTYVGGVVAETMASIATVALGLQKIEPSMQCVYQRAMRISRNRSGATKGGQHGVSVDDVYTTYMDKEGRLLESCSDLYYSKAPKCPFCNKEDAGVDRCMLVNPRLRPEDWKDAEDGREKIRRVMSELKTRGVLMSKLERNSDSFFRSNQLITSFDSFGGR